MEKIQKKIEVWGQSQATAYSKYRFVVISMREHWTATDNTSNSSIFYNILMNFICFPNGDSFHR